MRKLKRLWLCRDQLFYVVYVGKRPSKDKLVDGMWCDAQHLLCVHQFELTHSIRLAPGEGPVEVEPLKLKGGK